MDDKHMEEKGECREKGKMDENNKQRVDRGIIKDKTNTGRRRSEKKSGGKSQRKNGRRVE